MLAFIYAHEQGVHGVEVDVAMTKDNEIIVMHDNTLERTMEGAKGEVPHFTYDQIREMRYRRVTHHEYVIQDPRNRKVESVPLTIRAQLRAQGPHATPPSPALARA